MLCVIGNLKGGTGKSTLTFNLAVWLLGFNRRVGVFDLDPQQTLSDVAQIRREEGHTPRFHLLTRADQFEERVQMLRRINAEILVDVGVSDLPAMHRAMAVADCVVIPLAPSQADVWSTQRFLERIRTDRRKNNPRVLAVVNRADHAVEDLNETEAALDELPELERLPCRLYYRTLYRHSFSEGLAVFELDPFSRAANEIVALAEAIYPDQ